MEQYAPNVRWQVDTTLKVLTLAGGHVKDEYIYTLIHLISASPDQHAYAVHSTFLALRENLKQEGLVLFAMWMMGEFGQFLMQPYADSTLTAQSVSGADILRIIEDVLQNPKTATKIRDYALTCLIKLSVKLPSELVPQVNTLIMSQMNWPVSEVQQRSAEYLALMDAKFQAKRQEFVKAIPLSRRAETLAKSKTGVSGAEEEPERTISPSGAGKEEAKGSDIKKEFADLLLDIPQGSAPEPESKAVPASTINILEEVFKGIGTTPAAQVPTPNIMPDLIGFGAVPVLAPGPTAASVPTPATAPDLLNLFPAGGDLAAEPKKESAVPAPAGVKVEGFADANLRIEFEMDHKDAGKAGERHIVAAFLPLSGSDITSLNMQVALQKHVKMVALSPATGTTVMGNRSNTVRQEMRVANTMDGAKPIAMKIKVTYTCQGKAASEMKLVTFPMNA